MTTVYNKFLENREERLDTVLPAHPAPGYPGVSSRPGRLYLQRALQAVNSLSEQYATAGYGHGHRIAVMLDNRADFFLHLLALNKLGVSVVPVNSASCPVKSTT